MSADAGAGAAGPPSRLQTFSLRRRVTIATIAVLAVVLIAVALIVNALFRVESNRSLTAVIDDRAQLAQQLARQGARPAALVARVDSGEVRAQLTLPDGTTFGGLPANALPSSRGGPGVREQDIVLDAPGRRVDGATLTLLADAPLLVSSQSTLRNVLFFTALGALALTALLTVGATRFALAPLDAMAGLARSIAGGHRGRRLAPTRPDTELGRAATAFDEMLDALEGAEQRSRASEEGMRRFVADAAHELRTPIAGVQAAAEAVLQQAADAGPEDRERLHLLLIQESRRAGKLVSDLLDLARIDAGVELRREPVDLLALATTQADRARLMHPELTVRVVGSPLVAAVDADRIAQVVANLVDNACHATPSGGSVTVEVARHGDDLAELLVIDTGRGVPPGERDRIFDRLVRLDEARDRRAGGSGLGLPIARGLARAHGGDLRCIPGPATAGSGAVFQLLLPVPGTDC